MLLQQGNSSAVRLTILATLIQIFIDLLQWKSAKFSTLLCIAWVFGCRNARPVYFHISLLLVFAFVRLYTIVSPVELHNQKTNDAAAKHFYNQKNYKSIRILILGAILSSQCMLGHNSSQPTFVTSVLGLMILCCCPSVSGNESQEIASPKDGPSDLQTTSLIESTARVGGDSARRCEVESTLSTISKEEEIRCIKISSENIPGTLLTSKSSQTLATSDQYRDTTCCSTSPLLTSTQCAQNTDDMRSAKLPHEIQSRLFPRGTDQTEKAGHSDFSRSPRNIGFDESKSGYLDVLQRAELVVPHINELPFDINLDIERTFSFPLVDKLNPFSVNQFPFVILNFFLPYAMFSPLLRLRPCLLGSVKYAEKPHNMCSSSNGDCIRCVQDEINSLAKINCASALRNTILDRFSGFAQQYQVDLSNQPLSLSTSHSLRGSPLFIQTVSLFNRIILRNHDTFDSSADLSEAVHADVPFVKSTDRQDITDIPEIEKLTCRVADTSFLDANHALSSVKTILSFNLHTYEYQRYRFTVGWSTLMNTGEVVWGDEIGRSLTRETLDSLVVDGVLDLSALTTANQSEDEESEVLKPLKFLHQNIHRSIQFDCANSTLSRWEFEGNWTIELDSDVKPSQCHGNFNVLTGYVDPLGSVWKSHSSCTGQFKVKDGWQYYDATQLKWGSKTRKTMLRRRKWTRTVKLVAVN